MSETAAQTELQYDLYYMIPDAAGRRVLVLPGADGWTLPHDRLSDDEAWEYDALCRTLRERLGADVTVLRVAQAHIDREVKRQALLIYALENHDPAWAPPAGARWVTAGELPALALAPPEARAAVATWLAEEGGAIPAARPPWARRGWLAEASAWVRAELARQNRAPAGPLSQVKTWGISCLLRGETAAGAVYFKASPTLPLFTNEPAVTAMLGALYPAYVPQPLAVDADRRWMLLADFGGPLLGEADPAAYAATVAAFGALQRESAAHVEALLAAGCLDRRLPRLAAGIAPLVRDTAGVARLTDAEKAQLADAVPRLEAACAELAAYALPDTLVHGDIHQNNIAIRDGVPLFFDWSDACIAHPFFDLATLLHPERLAERGLERAPLLDRYLAAWADVASLPRLQEAARLGMLLGALHQAISYQHIVLSLEPAARWELEGGWVFWVRKVLAALDEGR